MTKLPNVTYYIPFFEKKAGLDQSEASICLFCAFPPEMTSPYFPNSKMQFFKNFTTPQSPGFVQFTSLRKP